jgi:hypothetical protein
MKKILSILSISLILSSCGETTRIDSTVTNDTLSKDTLVATAPPTDTLNPEYSDYAVYYMAVADTGTNYYKLDEKMYDLSIMMNFPVDTMGRHYDKKKDNIILSENDEDEIYRGEYYPRRGPDEHLSIEYLSFFDTAANIKTMVLLGGIYETQRSADSMVRLLKKQTPTAYTLKGWLYVGCMH